MSQKGSAYEREVCKALSLWWTAGKNPNVFWRTSNSGGRATVQAGKGRKMQVHCGDICAIDPVGEPFLKLFAVEVKRGYSRHTVADLFDKPKGAKEQVYEKWFAQAERSRVQSNAVAWLLVVKRDRRKPIVLVGLDDDGATELAESLPEPMVRIDAGDVWVYDFEYFFSPWNRDSFQEAMRIYESRKDRERKSDNPVSDW